MPKLVPLALVMHLGPVTHCLLVGQGEGPGLALRLGHRRAQSPTFRAMEVVLFRLVPGPPPRTLAPSQDSGTSPRTLSSPATLIVTGETPVMQPLC